MAGPDGRTPLLGDDDGGRLAPLDPRARDDFRDTVAAAAVLLDEPRLRAAVGAPPAALGWLFGPEGLERFERLPAVEPGTPSRDFLEGGFFVMRDEWTPDADHLVVDCGPHGMLNCGHAHADALSFVASAGGRPVLVDTGTYTYLYPPELRREMRLGRAHNTVEVDGASSSEPAGPFQWSHIARCTAERWLSRPRFDFFSGSHDGFRRLPDPALHRRSILFLKGEYWLVRDHIEAAGEHEVRAHLHFAPELSLSVEGSRIVAADAGEHGPEALTAFALGRGARVLLDRAPVSPAFGELTEGPTATIATVGRGDQEIFTLLVPGGRAPRSVEELPAAGGHCLRVDSGRGSDWLLTATEGRVLAGEIESDFRWAWLRWSRDGSRLLELLALDGRELVVGGRPVIRAGSPLGYLHARFGGELPAIDTDAAARPLLYGDASEPRPVGSADRVPSDVAEPASAS
jgi:hypothetical protein